MHTRTIPVGIIGFGMSGRIFNYPIITAVRGLRVVKVMERKAENRHLVPDGITIVDSPDGIINDPAIELVVVCTPNTVHFELAKRCLEAGKHVVVEKPFTINSADGRALTVLAHQKHLMLSVYHSRRFDADFLTIRKLLDEGRLGRIVNYEAHYDRFRKAIKPGWRESAGEGTGLLYDLGSHLIDQALVLFGEPQRVSAFVRMEREGAVAPDAFDVFLEYDNGPFVRLHSSMLARELGPRYIINGQLGSFVKRGIDVQEDHLKLGELPEDDPDWGREPEEIWGRFLTEREGIPHSEHVHSITGDYRQFYEDIVHAIINDHQPQVTGEAATAVIKVIELAMKSAREGSAQSWIQLKT